MTIHLDLSTFGLGNNLFMLAAGLELALKFNTDMICYEIPNVQNTTNSVANLSKILDFEIVHTSINLQNSTPIFKEKCPYCYEPRFEDLPDGSILTGYFQNQNYGVNSINFILDKLIASEQFCAIKKNIESTGVQIRLGDFQKKLIRRKIGLLSPKFFIKGLQVIDLECSSEIIIFSDETTKAENFVSENFPRLYRYVSEPDDSLPLNSMLRLGSFRRLILSNSTFGWWSAALGERAKITELVIAPEYWNRSNLCSRQLSKSDWIKIETKWR